MQEQGFDLVHPSLTSRLSCRSRTFIENTAVKHNSSHREETGCVNARHHFDAATAIATRRQQAGLTFICATLRSVVATVTHTPLYGSLTVSYAMRATAP
ncbi:hypothetical protein BAUCODRAFT_30079 [Baudoinia panamericana UAMH 10762]|uniref:Uncharacterized protein n=1 Tax=Baudoinia panamericana (strain UAMH 10762) TaxID=717646 RepID=M2N6J6_BAUPA|nr:uncharacterized protein BAUCODRAFT_30079 [Baudoinia panamericana UAMH 10762]EMC99703.1 hypothetical protein BAUCODRAFT_30079 [Baudoinia panamericana UAMH 10762]